MKIAVVIGGGSCPGIAPLVYYLHSKARQAGHSIHFFRGWDGLKLGQPASVSPDVTFLVKPGSPIGTSRYNLTGEDIASMKSQLAEFGAIIAVGGNDTLSVLTRLLEFQGIRIAVPKTLDNDLMGTDYTLGHWSVVEYLVGAILRARYSTLDHHRFLVVETIGQDAGWVALRAGRAVGADSIIIPEMGVSLPDVVKAIAERPTGLVVLTSSARILGLETPEAEVTAGDGFGNPHYEDRRIGHLLAARIHAEFGFDARCEVLTDSVRGGSTSSFDLLLAQRFANSAINVLSRLGPNKCVMLGLKGYRIEMSVLDQAPGRKFVAAEDILAL